jgi:hypothetical protein
MNDHSGLEPSQCDGALLNAAPARQEVQEAEAFD